LGVAVGATVGEAVGVGVFAGVEVDRKGTELQAIELTRKLTATASHRNGMCVPDFGICASLKKILSLFDLQ
jgi:hypothetical protein